jgi:hypothetical protein
MMLFRSLRTPGRSVILGAAAAMCVAAPTRLIGQDFWLVPNAFVVQLGKNVVVRGQASPFPGNEVALRPEELAEVAVLDGDGSEPLRDVAIHGTSLRLAVRPSAPGQFLITAVSRPTAIAGSAESVASQLQAGGGPDLAERFRTGGSTSADSVILRYVRYAKTFVEVGSGGPRVFDRAAGQPLELLPMRDPATLRSGDTIAVQVLLDGQPLANARVVAVGAPPALKAGGAERETERVEVAVMTGAEGVARIPDAGAGLWIVRATEILPPDDDQRPQWNVYSASLVLQVGSGKATEPPTGAQAPPSGVR